MSVITLSSTAVETIGAILNRKTSICQLLENTQTGLNQTFEVDHQSPEELIFDLFKLKDKDEACIGKLLSVLKSFGLREDDPRLRPMMDKLKEIESEQELLEGETKDPLYWNLDRTHFKSCISGSLVIISQALRNNLIVPSWHEFVELIRPLYLKCKPITTGKVATYIPQLARQDPNKWGVSICTVDGQRVSFGDATTPFCFQSVSKAFNYAILASDIGADAVHSYVGQEASGRFFNEICLDTNNKPHNPMVNSGAIVVSSLLKKDWKTSDRYDYMLEEYKKLAGGEYIGFNNATFLSERETADRNFALGHFMKECKCFPNPDQSIRDTLDFYFQLCSVESTCEGLAVMAATLANGGVCPLTAEKCLANRPCRDVLSLMYSCGMYDYSGQFAFHVGLPAKSGVSGAMIVVIPNLMGICLWSPPLDKMSNSVRGVEFCKEMISKFKFHNYDTLLHGEGKFDPRKTVGKGDAEQVVVLLFAAKNGDIRAIRRWYMQEASLEMSDYDGRTALHLAASEGHTELVKFLLHVAKVKHDPVDRWLRTPLDDAMTFGRDECARILEKARLMSIPPLMRHNLPKKPPVSAQAKKKTSVINETPFDEDDGENSSEEADASDEGNLDDDGGSKNPLLNKLQTKLGEEDGARSGGVESKLSDDDIEENDDLETAERQPFEVPYGDLESEYTFRKKLSIVSQKLEISSESESTDEDFEQQLKIQKKKSLVTEGYYEYSKVVDGEMVEGNEEDEELMLIASPRNSAGLYPKEEMLTTAACKSAEMTNRDATESVFSRLSAQSPDSEPSDFQILLIKETVSTISEIKLDASKLAKYPKS